MARKPETFRVVLDTNVLISAVIVPHGAPASILRAWRQGVFTLIMSSRQRAEFAEVLARPRIARKYDLTDNAAAAVLFLVDTLSVWVDPVTQPPLVVRDPKDAPILGMALTGEASYLVTGDDDLLTLASDPALVGVRIVTPRVFRANLSDDEAKHGA